MGTTTSNTTPEAIPTMTAHTSIASVQGQTRTDQQLMAPGQPGLHDIVDVCIAQGKQIAAVQTKPGAPRHLRQPTRFRRFINLLIGG